MSLLICLLFAAHLAANLHARAADNESFNEPLSLLRQKQEDAALDKLEAQESKTQATERLARRKATLARHAADAAAAARERVAALERVAATAAPAPGRTHQGRGLHRERSVGKDGDGVRAWQAWASARGKPHARPSARHLRYWPWQHPGKSISTASTPA